MRTLSSQEGIVTSLHVHPATAGADLIKLHEIELVEGKGVREDSRYFNRKSRLTGKMSKRQVTLIEREQIEEHSEKLGIPVIAAGVVRSNVETTGVSLQELVGCHVEIGEAILFLYEPRTPCPKMDAIHPGLQESMKNARQGVIGQVVRSGMVRIGDRIRRCTEA